MCIWICGLERFFLVTLFSRKLMIHKDSTQQGVGGYLAQLFKKSMFSVDDCDLREGNISVLLSKVPTPPIFPKIPIFLWASYISKNFYIFLYFSNFERWYLCVHIFRSWCHLIFSKQVPFYLFKPNQYVHCSEVLPTLIFLESSQFSY